MRTSPKTAAVAIATGAGTALGATFAMIRGSRMTIPVVVGAIIGAVLGGAAYVVMTGMGIE